MAALPVREEERSLPQVVAAALAISAIAQPFSFLVMVLYWTVENPWAEDSPSYLDFFLHGISWVLMLISFLSSRIPLSCHHGGWLIAFGVACVVWTYFHFALRLGIPGGCATYVQPDCPLYSVLDWHKPQVASTTSFLFLSVACPLAIVLYAMLARLRDACDNQLDLREMDDVVRRQMEALQARERELLKAAIEEEEQGYCFCRCR
ncbi:unnamed protein product [Effrenium voratum]|nr:unnamed protein product [Effrenium voratum]